MKYLSAFCLLCLHFISTGQDIIVSSQFSQNQIDFGSKVQLNFDLNLLTVCDNYESVVVFDYDAKTILVNITYHHSPACSLLLEVKKDSLDLFPFLIGEYQTTLNLDVESNPLLNQIIDLGTLDVRGNENGVCGFDFAYELPIDCPLIEHPVCTCSGKNYSNECVAFKFTRATAFLTEESCGEHLITRAQDFDYQTYIIDKVNFFEAYDCDDEEYIRDEIFIKYNHTESDTLELHIQQQTIQLFLVQIDNNNDIICIDKSVNGSLINSELPSGEYFIVVEEAPNTNSVTFLENPIISSLNTNEINYQLSSTLIEESLNLTLDSPTKFKATLLSLDGKTLISQSFTRQVEFSLGHLNQGLYLLTLTDGKSLMTERIIKM